jgi:hypothetical protein
VRPGRVFPFPASRPPDRLAHPLRPVHKRSRYDRRQNARRDRAEKPLTAETRKTANAELEKRHGAEIALIASWAEKKRLARDLKSSLPKALARG